MREIEFRGQRVDYGEWVYGLPRFTKYFPEVEISAIEDENGNVYEDINPETIGQFTGLLDKNGNKIFEGDIDKSGMIIMFHNNAFQLCSLVCKEVIQAIPLWCFDNKTFDQIEITGNIHEEN